MSFTETIAVGRFVADPEMKPYGKEGKSLARFRIAVNISKDKSAFYNCVAFDRTAETIQNYCHKGKQVLVAGQFQNSDYEKDVNGEKVMMYGMELNVSRLTLLGDASGGGQQQGGQRQQSRSQQGGYQNQQRGGYQQTASSQPQQQQNTGSFGGFGGFDQGGQGGFGGFSNDDLPF